MPKIANFRLLHKTLLDLTTWYTAAPRPINSKAVYITIDQVAAYCQSGSPLPPTDELDKRWFAESINEINCYLENYGIAAHTYTKMENIYTKLTQAAPALNIIAMAVLHQINPGTITLKLIKATEASTTNDPLDYLIIDMVTDVSYAHENTIN